MSRVTSSRGSTGKDPSAPHATPLPAVHVAWAAGGAAYASGGPGAIDQAGGAPRGPAGVSPSVEDRAGLPSPDVHGARNEAGAVATGWPVALIGHASGDPRGPEANEGGRALVWGDDPAP